MNNSTVSHYNDIYHVCAFGRLSGEAVSMRYIVNSLGPTAPVDPAEREVKVYFSYVH